MAHNIVGPNLINKEGAIADVEKHLEGKIVGIYFSAHWCPPCRMFTPQLAKTYKDIVDAGKNFEIIFCSSDRDQKAFDTYYGEQPWASIPFDKLGAVKGALSQRYNVQGIPTLVILNSKGEVITRDGRRDISQHKAGAYDVWASKN